MAGAKAVLTRMKAASRREAKGVMRPGYCTGAADARLS
jgi:hypothetical protein